MIIILFGVLMVRQMWYRSHAKAPVLNPSYFPHDMVDTGLSGYPLHWYFCLLPLEIVPPTSWRNTVTALLHGALMSAM